MQASPWLVVNEIPDPGEAVDDRPRGSLTQVFLVSHRAPKLKKKRGGEFP